MKIVAMFVSFLYFVDPTRGQSEVDSETKVTRDSGWWSRRITKINGRGEHRIGLPSEDNRQRQAGRWEKKTIIRDSSRRPRPFASVLSSNAETRFQDHFESQREHLRSGKVSPLTVDLNVSQAPSPILLPPFATPSPVYRINIFAENATLTPQWNDESSLNAGKSTTRLALERIKIYEITTSNPANNETIESKPSHVDDSSKSSNANDENIRWMSFARDSYVSNGTKQRNNDESDVRTDAKNDVDSFYINAKPGNAMRTSSFKPATNGSNFIKSDRGEERYRDDFPNENVLMRKRTFARTGRYDWRRRSGQRSNYQRFRSDTNEEVGSVPGLPGRDYPIHQEHTHHRLRNVAERFPCPRTPKTQVYLADRASRCQIFYVCYGSKTGVPMVCPNGTLFSESLRVCDWWYNVAC